MNHTGRGELLRALSTAVDDGRPIAVATVVDTTGSVPRHPGAKMLVYGDGSTLGTVGGGAAEALVRDDALDAIERGATRIETYTLQDPDRGDPGICGGTMIIALEPYMPPNTLLVVGCGHVGRAVIDLAHWLGYRTVAVDDRPELVTEEELPNADVRFAGSLVDAVEAHPITPSTSVVVVTRNHDLDVEILPELVASPAGYVGVMGSRRRWAMTRDRLIESGTTAEALERVHVPIGIEIGAESVEEIAVSIMSEVIASTPKDRG